MKKFLFALAAATLTATPVLAAPPQAHGHQAHQAAGKPGPSQTARKSTPSRQAAKAHQWKRGDRFDRSKASNYRVINNPRAYKLQSAPKGYRWVQSGRDALLVRLSNNVITSVMTNAIR